VGRSGSGIRQQLDAASEVHSPWLLGGFVVLVVVRSVVLGAVVPHAASIPKATPPARHHN